MLRAVERRITVPLSGALFASGLFLLIAGLAERQHGARVVTALSLCLPAILLWLRGYALLEH
jgi:hypothetical protein